MGAARSTCKTCRVALRVRAAGARRRAPIQSRIVRRSTWRTILPSGVIFAMPAPLRRTLCPVLAACALLLTVVTAHAGDSWQPQPYRLGQGLYAPALGLHLGGYANLHYYDLGDHPAALTVHDVSLFVTKDLGSRWKLFSELEVSDGLSIRDGHATTAAAEFDVERLYADYHARPGINLRLGKFLTPVGQWNLVHADPLVWTVSRPLTTTAAFARHASGAMLYGTVTAAGRDLDYWLFADDSDDLAPAQDRDQAFSAYGADSSLHNNFLHAVGGRVLYHLFADRLAVGASYVSYELQNPRHHYRLRGIDFSWNQNGYSLSGEGIDRSGDAGVRNEYGGYLQAVVPMRSLSPRLYLVGRIERYHSALLDRFTVIRTLGLNYRPLPGLALKLERRSGHANALLEPSGWLASFAVLF